MQYFLEALNKYADFSGKASRQEYWMFVLFYLIIYIGLVVVESILGTAFLTLLYSLGLFIPSISIATRRLHDTDRSGWWQLIVLIPIIGFVVLIVFLAQASKSPSRLEAKRV